MTAATTTRPRLRSAASVLAPRPDTARDCTCGSPACLSRADVTDLAHMLVSMYVEADDLTAARLRAEYAIDGPRPEGAGQRWYSRWAGELAEALSRRAHPRVRTIADDEALVLA